MRRISRDICGGFAGGVDAQDKKECVPSTTAQAKIDQATSTAVGNDVALALSEVTQCGSKDDLESQVRIAGKEGSLFACNAGEGIDMGLMVVQEGSPLALSLSLAISTGVDALGDECGEDTQAAAEAVAASVVKGVQNEVKKVKPEAEEEFSVSWWVICLRDIYHLQGLYCTVMRGVWCMKLQLN